MLLNMVYAIIVSWGYWLAVKGLSNTITGYEYPVFCFTLGLNLELNSYDHNILYMRQEAY
jgi:hypothetical protein